MRMQFLITLLHKLHRAQFFRAGRCRFCLRQAWPVAASALTRAKLKRACMLLSYGSIKWCSTNPCRVCRLAHASPRDYHDKHTLRLQSRESVASRFGNFDDHAADSGHDCGTLTPFASIYVAIPRRSTLDDQWVGAK